MEVARCNDVHYARVHLRTEDNFYHAGIIASNRYTVADEDLKSRRVTLFFYAFTLKFFRIHIYKIYFR